MFVAVGFIVNLLALIAFVNEFGLTLFKSLLPNLLTALYTEKATQRSKSFFLFSPRLEQYQLFFSDVSNSSYPCRILSLSKTVCLEKFEEH